MSRTKRLKMKPLLYLKKSIGKSSVKCVAQNASMPVPISGQQRIKGTIPKVASLIPQS